MPLSETTITLVRRTFEQVMTNPNTAAVALYARLKEIAPHTVMIFAGTDMVMLGRHFIDMVSASVIMLDDPDGLSLSMSELGHRHHQYGVQGQDFAPFGEALLWALERSLGAAFTPEVRNAWREVFDYLTELMEPRHGS